MSKEIENIERLMEKKDTEFRDFKLTKCETRKDESGNEKLIVEGVACVYETETVLYKGQFWEFREIVDSKAFKGADVSDVIFNYNHSGRVYARTRNNSLKLEDKSDGLHMRAELWKDDDGHGQLYRDIERGNIDKMSFAFRVKESEFKEIEKQDEPNVEIRTITKIDKLFDVSAVDIPAYNATEISARRTLEAVSQKRELEKAEAESRARAIYNYQKTRGDIK